MAGVRQLRELSAARLSAHGRVSRSDGDDSRPISPDKQLKACPPGKALVPSSTAGKQQQAQHGSSRPRPPQATQRSLQLQQPKQRVGRLGIAQQAQKEFTSRRSVPKQSVAAQPPGSARVTPAHTFSNRRGAAAATTGPTQFIPSAGLSGTAGSYGPAKAAQTAGSSSGQSVSTESSFGSVVSPHEQLLLAAAINHLHSQQPQQQQQPSWQEDSDCSWPLTGQPEHQTGAGAGSKLQDQQCADDAVSSSMGQTNMPYVSAHTHLAAVSDLPSTKQLQENACAADQGVAQQVLLPRQPSAARLQQRPSSALGLRPAPAAAASTASADAAATAAVLAAMHRGTASVLQQQQQCGSDFKQQELPQEQLAAEAAGHQQVLFPGCSDAESAGASSGSSQLQLEEDMTHPNYGQDAQEAAQNYGQASVQQQQQLRPQSNPSSAAAEAEDTASTTAARARAAAAAQLSEPSDMPAQLSSRDVSEVLLSGRGSLTASEFEAITRDVAARIIQTHWHIYTQRRRQKQREQQQQQQQGEEKQQEAEQQQQLQQQRSWQETNRDLAVEQDGVNQKEAQQEQQQQQALQQQLSAAQQHEQQHSLFTDDSCSSCGSVARQAPPAYHQPSAQQSTPVEAATLASTGISLHVSTADVTQTATSTAAGRGHAAASLVPQTSAAALGKLRAAAGSRNAAKLQQYRPAGGAAHPVPEAIAGHAANMDSASVPPQQQQQPWQQQEQYAECSTSMHNAVRPVSSASPASVGSSGGSSGLQQQQQQQGVPGGDKLSTILAFLDAVEQEAPVVPAGVQVRPATSCQAAQPHTGTTAPRPHTAQLASSTYSLRHHQVAPPPQQQRQQQPVLMLDAPVLRQDASSAVGAWAAGVEAVPALRSDPSAAFSVASGAGGPPGPANNSRPAVLAESVFDGVKAKMRNMRAALATKDNMLQALTQEMEVMRDTHQQQLQQLAAAHQQQLSTAAAESSAALSRHMGLMDRLMEEKSQLANKLEEAQKAAVVAEDWHAAAVAALKQGWAAELKRQAANWEAAAAAKQEAWRTAKVAEIKEQTVKGLEVEVQRLINRHRAELEAAHERAAEQVKVAQEAAKVEQEAQLQALRDKLRKQQEEAIERERCAAAARLCEASERWEAQLQASRMRLAADNDINLEAAAAATREEKRKGEAALEAAEARFAAREALLKDEWGREKEALARSHARAMEAAKQAAADERTAWRAAVTEKLKRQAAEREEKLRAELLKQRDEQLEVVIRRLEAEGAAARAAAAEKVAAEHAAATTALQEQLQQSQKGAKRLAERGKAAAAAAAAAERQKLELEQQLEQARQELAGQHRALVAAKAALSAKEAEAATAAATAAANAACSLQQLQSDKARLEGRLQEVQEQLRQARQQHEVEMQHVELRVKAAIARKDESIQQLQQQLAAAVDALRGTEAVLAAQQEELYD